LGCNLLAVAENEIGLTSAALSQHGIDTLLKRVGDWLMRHQAAIRAGQWAVVCCYLVLVVVPAFLPMPAKTAHIWTNLTLFAQFVFWGVWWPFVLLSMILVGRLWCGLICPEGALSEFVSSRGKGHAVPHWMTWRGWPFVAFAGTTIYGQMVSVYQYAAPALLVLGGSTLGAIIVGFLYGRNKRVWCRYLCPVNGVFGLLSKLAPLHFAVDPVAWRAWPKHRGTRATAMNCAPLVPIRTMQGNSLCHMCGRCSGFRGAVTLSRRSPNFEIVHVAGNDPKPVETVLIVFGLIGIAFGAFHWSSSELYIDVKQFLAEWLVNHGLTWPLEPIAPWWILTNYPDQNDMLSPVDGVVLLADIFGIALVLGGFVMSCIAAAARTLDHWSVRHLHHLTQALVPVAGCGVFLGLSSLTVTMLHGEGLALDFVGALRALLLASAGLWSLWLGWQITALYTTSSTRRVAAMVPFAIAIGATCASWATLFWQF
jgi:polyferredoxin